MVNKIGIYCHDSVGARTDGKWFSFHYGDEDKLTDKFSYESPGAHKNSNHTRYKERILVSKNLLPKGISDIKQGKHLGGLNILGSIEMKINGNDGKKVAYYTSNFRPVGELKTPPKLLSIHLQLMLLQHLKDGQNVSHVIMGDGSPDFFRPETVESLRQIGIRQGIEYEIDQVIEAFKKHLKVT